MIGREQEQQAIQAKLQEPTQRLITILGMGGIGKSRLALQVAHDLPADFSYDVYYLDLVPLTNPELLLPAICHTVGVKVAPVLTQGY